MLHLEGGVADLEAVTQEALHYIARPCRSDPSCGFSSRSHS